MVAGLELARDLLHSLQDIPVPLLRSLVGQRECYSTRPKDQSGLVVA